MISCCYAYLSITLINLGSKIWLLSCSLEVLLYDAVSPKMWFYDVDHKDCCV